MLIFCECKCGNKLESLDKKNRPRKYIRGHNKSRLGSKQTPDAIKKIKIARANQKFSEATRLKMSLARNGSKNIFWKNGRHTGSNGYILIWKPEHPLSNKDGYVLEHRLVMEKNLGRYLTKLEVIHHKNRKRDDNRIENLELFSNHSEHIKIGHKK